MLCQCWVTSSVQAGHSPVLPSPKLRLLRLRLFPPVTLLDTRYKHINLQGWFDTTSLVDCPIPQRESLRPVPLEDTSCNLAYRRWPLLLGVLQLQTPLLFPVPSIFGGSSFGFGSASNTVNQKCQQVAAAQMRPAAQAAENPQWTCGIVVDGQMSCQGKVTAAYWLCRFVCQKVLPVQTVCWYSKGCQHIAAMHQLTIRDQLLFSIAFC